MNLPQSTLQSRNMPSPRQRTGRRGEELAAEYLEARGYRILVRNYRFRRAELDLVCYLPALPGKGAGELVIVEVKARNTLSYGFPEEAVNRQKQQNLIRGARAFVRERRMERTPCRFDVISIENVDGRFRIDHFENAFDLG